MKSEVDFEHRSEPYIRTESEERRNRRGVRVFQRFPRVKVTKGQKRYSVAETAFLRSLPSS